MLTPQQKVPTAPALARSHSAEVDKQEEVVVVAAAAAAAAAAARPDPRRARSTHPSDQLEGGRAFAASEWKGQHRLGCACAHRYAPQNRRQVRERAG